MAKSTSAGLMMYSGRRESLRVLLAHPGGPLFAKKDVGYWSIPKGLVEPGEDLLRAARREFAEETGLQPTDAVFINLGAIEQKGGKTVHAWAFEGTWEAGREPQSNTFRMPWPPRSGRLQEFPEIDRAEMFSIAAARGKINSRQQPFLDRLVDALAT